MAIEQSGLNRTNVDLRRQRALPRDARLDRIVLTAACFDRKHMGPVVNDCGDGPFVLRERRGDNRACRGRASRPAYGEGQVHREYLAPQRLAGARRRAPLDEDDEAGRKR